VLGRAPGELPGTAPIPIAAAAASLTAAAAAASSRPSRPKLLAEAPALTAAAAAALTAAAAAAIGLRLFLQQQLASLTLMDELSLCLAQPIA
jgi:hypothetical protein